ncbi:hypothetical protein OUZ56_005932 [Daphnia magna]|uniref:Uncharacterized protein n=1 Tax=Daphnia magna TaxID=35525 RepID=A0ABQ9YU62_9CRUS|nr:hypothetical protein OUZ56_005932 [Daphnia magna]
MKERKHGITGCCLDGVSRVRLPARVVGCWERGIFPTHSPPEPVVHGSSCSTGSAAATGGVASSGSNSSSGVGGISTSSG